MEDKAMEPGKTALVLGGGGSRGAYELGVWQALRELDISIDLVTGTSIGAINGAIIAQGDYETAVSLWNSIETGHVMEVDIDEEKPLPQKIWKTYQNFAVNFIRHGGTDTYPLKETLATCLDEKKVRSSSIGYGLVTIEKDTIVPRELMIEEIPEGKLIDYIIASASVYPAFKPHAIDDVEYVDGAYHDNLPVALALRQGAVDVIAVDLEPFFGVVRRDYLKQARRVVYIRSYWPLGPTLVFDRQTIRRNIRLGYLDGMKAFGVYEGNAYTFQPGFVSRTAEQLSPCLPLKELLNKSGGGSFDQLFLAGINRMLEDRGVTDPDQNREDTALACAEIAGEVFGLSGETIYTYESWKLCLQEQLEDTSVPDGKILISRQSRAILAGTMIAGLLKQKEYRRPVESLTVLPEAFLAGVYLASAGLLNLE